MGNKQSLLSSIKCTNIGIILGHKCRRLRESFLILVGRSHKWHRVHVCMCCYGGETVTTTTSHVGAAWYSGIDLPPTIFCNYRMGRFIQRSSRGLIASVKRPCIFPGNSAPGSYQKCLVWTVVGVAVGLKTPGSFFPGIVHVVWKGLYSAQNNNFRNYVHYIREKCWLLTLHFSDMQKHCFFSYSVHVTDFWKYYFVLRKV